MSLNNPLLSKIADNIAIITPRKYTPNKILPAIAEGKKAPITKVLEPEVDRMDLMTENKLQENPLTYADQIDQNIE